MTLQAIWALWDGHRLVFSRQWRHAKMTVVALKRAVGNQLWHYRTKQWIARYTLPFLKNVLRFYSNLGPHHRPLCFFQYIIENWHQHHWVSSRNPSLVLGDSELMTPSLQKNDIFLNSFVYDLTEVFVVLSKVSDNSIVNSHVKHSLFLKFWVLMPFTFWVHLIKQSRVAQLAQKKVNWGICGSWFSL